MSEAEDLRVRLVAIEAHMQAMLDTPLAGTVDRRARLKATPQGIQVLRKTFERLLTTGELWWNDE